MPLAENPAYLTDQILTYIGNKRALLHFIGQGLDRVKKRTGHARLSTFDVFSGSGVVARYLKQHSHRLVCCDIEAYSHAVNNCYLTNRADVNHDAVRQAVDEVNQRAINAPREGFIAELYAPRDDHDIQPGERVFYTRRNACFLDAARQAIDSLDESVRPFVLAPLLYKASVHANTSGVFKGFYKNSRTGIGQFGGNGRDALSRILADIHLPMPVFSQFTSDVELHRGDANDVIRHVDPVDVAYIDPPYNQHPYGSNYFMLNLLVDYQRPDEISRVSGIPTDWNRSRYNKRPQAHDALADLVDNINARFLLVSFNSEGFITHEDMTALLGRAGRVESLETRYNTFRGSRNLRQRNPHVTEYVCLVEKT